MLKVINPSGYIFENMRGGPYKYGIPLKATLKNLKLKEQGKL